MVMVHSAMVPRGGSASGVSTTAAGASGVWGSGAMESVVFSRLTNFSLLVSGAGARLGGDLMKAPLRPPEAALPVFRPAVVRYTPWRDNCGWPSTRTETGSKVMYNRSWPRGQSGNTTGVLDDVSSMNANSEQERICKEAKESQRRSSSEPALRC